MTDKREKTIRVTATFQKTFEEWPLHWNPYTNVIGGIIDLNLKVISSTQLCMAKKESHNS